VHWSSWTSTQGKGSGYYRWNACRSGSCHVRTRTATFRVFRVRTHDGEELFTRITVTTSRSTHTWDLATGPNG
jgi:hypothetical protein